MKRRQEAAEEAERQRLQAEADAKAAAEAQAEAARQAEIARDQADAPGSPGSGQHEAGMHFLIEFRFFFYYFNPIKSFNKSIKKKHFLCVGANNYF